jgi:hypothetical protein
MVASLDLKSTLDTKDVKLLLKRLKIIAPPRDNIELSRVWLKNRSYYISIHGVNFVLLDSILGAVQRSILGPIIFAIFDLPLFDIEDVSSFANDTYTKRSNKIQTELKKK